jgi:hypothetical protein
MVPNSFTQVDSSPYSITITGCYQNFGTICVTGKTTVATVVDPCPSATSSGASGIASSSFTNDPLLLTNEGTSISEDLTTSNGLNWPLALDLDADFASVGETSVCGPFKLSISYQGTPLYAGTYDASQFASITVGSGGSTTMLSPPGDTLKFHPPANSLATTGPTIAL